MRLRSVLYAVAIVFAAAWFFVLVGLGAIVFLAAAKLRRSLRLLRLRDAGRRRAGGRGSRGSCRQGAGPPAPLDPGAPPARRFSLARWMPKRRRARQTPRPPCRARPQHRGFRPPEPSDDELCNRLAVCFIRDRQRRCRVLKRFAHCRQDVRAKNNAMFHVAPDRHFSRSRYAPPEHITENVWRAQPVKSRANSN